MKVEHENFLRAILRSVQRRRSRSGTSRYIARAKSAFITMALALCTPAAVRTPTARRTLEEHLLHRFVEADLHAKSLAPPAPSPPSPLSSRRSDGRRHIRIRGMTGSKTGSGTGMATCRGISTEMRRPGGCADRGKSA